MKSIILSLLLLVFVFASAEAQSEFSAGLSAYQNGDWQGALQSWEQLAFSGESSGALEFNIGNAYFRLGETASAILHFERALLFLPNDGDVLHNLRLANLGTIDKIDPTLRLGIWDAADGLRDAHNTRELARYVLWASLLTATLAGLLLWVPLKFRRILRRLTFGLGTILMLLVIVYVWRASYETQSRAIVMVEKSDIYSGPSDSSTQLFSLHAGSKVQVHEELSGWTKVGLADGREGWMKVSDATKI